MSTHEKLKAITARKGESTCAFETLSGLSRWPVCVPVVPERLEEAAQRCEADAALLLETGAALRRLAGEVEARE